MARRQKSIPDRHHCEAAVFLAPARQSLHSRDEADREFHPRSRVKRFVQATAKSGLGGTLVAARVNTNGVIIWKSVTGIDRILLSQILPGVNSVAFVGPRPQVRGMVSEPLMVIVDSRTGAMSASSFWK